MPRPELEESNVQFREAWKLYARASRGGEVIDAPGICIVDANQPWVFMNLGFLTGERDPETRRHTQELIDHFMPDGRPWALVACEDYLTDDALETFTALRLAPFTEIVGMVADPVVPPTRPLPDVELRTIKNEETKLALADLNANAYRVPSEWGREALVSDGLWQQPIYGAVAYVEDEPVASAFATPIEDVLYVGWVATAAEHRRRGYAELVIRRSLEDAGRATGLQRTALHATADGYPVYKRMGYRDVTKFPMFVPV